MSKYHANIEISSAGLHGNAWADDLKVGVREK